MYAFCSGGIDALSLSLSLVRSKQVSLALFCTLTMLAIASGSFAQTIGGQDPDPQPTGQPRSVYFAIGDLNANGLLDYCRSAPDEDLVQVFMAMPDDTFVLAASFTFWDPAAVAIGDVDSDGLLDIVVSSRYDDSLHIGYGNGLFAFTFDSPISVGIDAGVVVVVDSCEDGLPEIIVANDGLTTHKLITSPAVFPIVYTVTNTTQILCPGDDQVGTLPCNNMTEPACSPTPAHPGVQECMRAAECRGAKCKWAACVLLHGGSGPRWTKRPAWVGHHAACSAVLIFEVASCLAP